MEPIGKSLGYQDAFHALRERRAEAITCGMRVVEGFAAGLAQAGAAVRAGLRLPLSSGQAEGQANRLKLLKRSMYGRAKLDLLRVVSHFEICRFLTLASIPASV